MNFLATEKREKRKRFLGRERKTSEERATRKHYKFTRLRSKAFAEVGACKANAHMIQSEWIANETEKENEKKWANLQETSRTNSESVCRKE